MPSSETAAAMPAEQNWEYACPLPDPDGHGRCNGALNVTVKGDGRVLMRCRRVSCEQRSGWILELAHVLDADSVDDLKARWRDLLAPYTRPGVPKRRKSVVDRSPQRVDSLPYGEQLAMFRRRLRLSPDLRTYLTDERGWSPWTLKSAEVGYARPGELRGVVFADHAAFTLPVRDATGELVNVYRRFYPVLPFGRIKWVGLRGRPMALYPSPPATDRVVICEGLADALMARQYGLDAVSATTGAAVKWPEEWCSHVRGAQVVVAYDAGAAVSKARKLAEYLRVNGAERAWVLDLGDLAGLDDDQDVSDLFSQGWTAAQFKTLINAACPRGRGQR